MHRVRRAVPVRRQPLGAIVAAALASLVAACGGNPAAPAAVPGSSAGIAFQPPAYDRDQWPHWIDEDGDCQDARAEVLIRESRAPVTFRARSDGRPCVVDTGLWVDPYGGETFTEASILDVDHVVPLGNAHRAGGWAWDPERKRGYANDLTDPRHLVPVSAALNRMKSDKGPEQWTPPNAAHLCAYGESWSAIKARWQLSMTSEEASAISDLLSRCR